MFEFMSYAALGVSLSGYLFGYFRHHWEEGWSQDAYPKAVRISRWIGFVFSALFFIYEMRQAFGGQLAIFMLLGVVILTPVAGFLACGFSRPFVYLGALLYSGRVRLPKPQD